MITWRLFSKTGHLSCHFVKNKAKANRIILLYTLELVIYHVIFIFCRFYQKSLRILFQQSKWKKTFLEGTLYFSINHRSECLLFSRHFTYSWRNILAAILVIVMRAGRISLVDARCPPQGIEACWLKEISQATVFYWQNQGQVTKMISKHYRCRFHKNWDKLEKSRADVFKVYPDVIRFNLIQFYPCMPVLVLGWFFWVLLQC